MEGLLKKAVTTDLAVGIPNVAGFMSFATQLFMQNGLREYIGFFFNIHNFKYVNKILPHMQADEVMRIYAGMLMNMVESDEIAARLGGDNFVALIREENVERFVGFIRNLDITYQYEDEIKKFNFGATIGEAFILISLCRKISFWRKWQLGSIKMLKGYAEKSIFAYPF